MSIRIIQDNSGMLYIGEGDTEKICDLTNPRRLILEDGKIKIGKFFGEPDSIEYFGDCIMYEVKSDEVIKSYKEHISGIKLVGGIV
jgi:hypothetical protein